MPAPPQLPTKFPCWCRATYSWGGETKRDLGFVEGDLIECLNAGDGQWWMGRLRRDKRMVGLFPSNFVQVLENYTPVSRNASPLPLQSPAGSLTKTSPQKSKSVFRKPFQAYYKASAPNPEAAAREIKKRDSDVESPKNLTPPGSVNKHRPYSSMKRSSTESRGASPSPLRDTHTPSEMRSAASLAKRNSRTYAPSPARPAAHSQLGATSPVPPRAHVYPRAVSPAPPRQYHQEYSRAPSPAPPPDPYSYSRGPSPAPPISNDGYRATSPVPPMPRHTSRATSPAPPVPHYGQRGASPAPPSQYQAYSRAASPARSYIDYDDLEDSPPPAPPPHRVLNANSRAPSPLPPQHGHGRGYHTPEPPSPRPGNLTPSPLTNAMNDVMSSLHDMGMQRESPPAKPPGIWSPEAFDQIHRDTRKNRAMTSLGIGAHEEDASAYVPSSNTFSASNMENHTVDNYVQRMESRLRQLQAEDARSAKYTSYKGSATYDDNEPPLPPSKSGDFPRSHSSLERDDSTASLTRSLSKRLRNRKSAYELGREVLGRTFTTKSSATNSSSGVQSTTTQSTNSTNKTSASIMSAGGFSATSAGSLARKKWALGGSSRPNSVMETRRKFEEDRPETPFTGVTYHSSHASGTDEWQSSVNGSGSGVLGGLTAPKHKKSGFLRKMVESAKTGAASARSAIASGTTSRPVSRQSKMEGIEGFVGSSPSRPTSSAGRDMGLSGTSDWMQVRRDVNRSNSLSKNERLERAERCQMNDIPTFSPVDTLLESAEGDEGLDGLPIAEPMDFTQCNLAMVDKSVRFISNLPPTLTAAGLAQGYVCRPYRSDVQRLRAIFTWVSERIAWEEDYEGDVDSRRVLNSKRGGSQEVAVLVAEMCTAVGLHAEVVRGFLKIPGEHIDPDMSLRPNHWWNTVIVDGEWRIMDCSLAMPSNPKRCLFSSVSSQIADSGFFLARPLEICYTHVPIHPEQQHICPPMDHAVLMALPVACPPYFSNMLQLFDFDTSILYLENLEVTQIHILVPSDVECVAEVEARIFSQDGDGDFFESGDVVRKRALSQAEWVNGQKRYTVKAVLPGDEGQGVLKLYAGKRGLMHSIKSIPHPLAFALPLTHTGLNPTFDFVTLHPTPHAQRHDLYVAQPQCARLALNNTFVFAVRQHPSSLHPSSPPASSSGGFDANGRSISRAASPNPFARPASAMSIMSSSQSGSQYSHPSNSSGSSSGVVGPNGQKPAKLAIQSPAGKIIRLIRKSDHMVAGHEGGDGGVWETVIKIGERGTWRGLVLADRTARWCVFAEWECA